MDENSTVSRGVFARVGSILKADANVATEWHNSSQAEFQRVYSKPNGGTPEEVREATSNLNLAIEALVLAHVRLNGFLIERNDPRRPEVCRGVL